MFSRAHDRNQLQADDMYKLMICYAYGQEYEDAWVGDRLDDSMVMTKMRLCL